MKRDLEMMVAWIVAILLIVLVWTLTARAQEGPVSVAIVLAADVSGSISDDRFKLQREGYAYALTHPEVVRAIQGTAHGRIALTYVEWSTTQRVVVPWMVIATAEDAERFARQLYNAPRSSSDMTGVGDAIAFSLATFGALAAATDARVIDVSGDGMSNIGQQPSTARDAAIAAGVTVNGIVLPSIDAGLEEYYRENVIGGFNAFAISVDDWEAFAYALVNKLVREIALDNSNKAHLS